MRYSTEEKAMILEEWKRSGKSICSYVKEKGLVRWTFTKWLKAERTAGQGFVEVPAKALQGPTHLPEILIEKGDVKIHIPLGLHRDELCGVMEGLGAAL